MAEGDIVDTMFGWILDLFSWIVKMLVKVAYYIVIFIGKYAWKLLVLGFAWIVSLFDKDEKNASTETDSL